MGVDSIKAVNKADDKNRRDGDGLMRLREAGYDGEGRRGVGRESGQSREKFFLGLGTLRGRSVRGEGGEMTKVAGIQNKRGRALRNGGPGIGDGRRKEKEGEVGTREKARFWRARKAGSGVCIACLAGPFVYI